MNRLMQFIIALLVVVTLSVTLLQCNTSKPKEEKEKEEAVLEGGVQMNPFLNHRDSVPSSSQYNGTLFTLSHNYPDAALPPFVNPPWQQALNGQPLSTSNALSYVEAIKGFVAPTITQFLYNRNNFNADSAGWFQEPWTGSQREAIMGTYVGSGFGPGTFTSLDSNMTTYVLTFYDQRAANTLHNIWGKSAEQVNLKNNAGQFQQGSVIVKFAFTTANYPLWKEMENALTFPIYDTGTAYTDPVYRVRNVSFFQFDMIVKDTMNSPNTGWVFSTLVYDKHAPGKTVWDKMVPLGAMWGNDPEVNSTKFPKEPLKENVINMKAPLYSRQTLGWGDRLSGPNDGAVIPIAKADGKMYMNLKGSACMSCHLTAQDAFKSFLLPAPFPTNNSDTLTVFEPGGKEWVRWFRNLEGDVPFDAGETGLDFDMVTAFKSIPAFNSAKLSAEDKAKLGAAELYRQRPHNKYNGR